MERIALTHRGCATARGCGCLVDKVLGLLQATEAQLFAWEIDSYANPDMPRRIVGDDNVVTMEQGRPRSEESKSVDAVARPYGGSTE